MTFGEKLFNLFSNARTKGGGILHRDEWIKIANDLFQKENTKSKRGLGKVTTTDEEWIVELEAEPSLAGIAIRKELAKAQFWCKNNRRKCTRKMFLNWLGKADRSVAHGGGETSVVKQDIYVEPTGWKTSKRAQAKLGFSDESWQLLIEKGWFNISPDWRKDILKAI